MPTLVRIGNLKIQVFADDHNPPHFHVVTPNHEALVGLATLTVLRGEIRRRDLDSALEWVRENRETVAGEWERLNGK
jgi:hypothetical protein